MSNSSAPLSTNHPPRASSVPDRVLSPARKETADARRARREQLRDFYGLSGGAGGASSTPGSPDMARAGSHSPVGVGIGMANAHGLASPAPSVGAVMAAANAQGTGATPSPTPGRKRRAHGGAGAGGDGVGRRDLSSTNFVPAEYYEELISRASLSELLQTTSTLATDVGRLQSSRHTLVYNHHHQLFSAGDTIAALNTRTPQLLSIVTSLQERFSDMSQLADSVALPELAADEKAAATAGAGGDAQAAAAAAAQGLERVRLMVLAEAPVEKVQEVWRGVEAKIVGGSGVAGLDGVLREGRELAGLASAAV